MRSWAWMMIAALAAPFAAQADNSPPATGDAMNTLYQAGVGSKNWSDYETDTAPASISAAGMLGLSGGAITTVESIKDLSVALNALSSDGTNAGLALAFTPARSALSPMSQTTYVGPKGSNPVAQFFLRLIGSTAFGYARNDTTISNVKYAQQAASIQASGFFDSQQDPVVALVNAIRDSKYGCGVGDILGQDDTAPTPKPGSAPGGSLEPPMVDAATAAKRAAAWDKCKTAIAKSVPWNPSTYSVGYATGWIKSTAGGSPQYSLGKTVFAGAQYGWSPRKTDPNATLGVLFAAAYRRSIDEPVLQTLNTGPVQYKSSNLYYAKLAGGSATFRGLVEYNSTHSTGITPTDISLKIAVGIDARLAKNTWINFRFGKQNTVDNTGTQKASLISISYSPDALLSN